MIEKYFQDMNIGSQKTVEEFVGDEPVVEREENPEEKKWRELKESYAEQLRTPKGSWVKNIRNITGALVLAGITVFGSPETSVAPTISAERLVVENLGMIRKGNDPEEAIKHLPGADKKEIADAYRAALDSIKTRGGVYESPELPGKVYKNRTFAGINREVSVSPENQYFKKPELILGKDFIKKNPEQAREYMEKINETMRSTVLIETPGGLGSGVIIDTTGGKAILTNAHVVGGHKEVSIRLSGGSRVIGMVSFVDRERDLAIVNIDITDIIDNPKDFNYTPEAEKTVVNSFLEGSGAASLELEEESAEGDPVQDQKVLMMGNPLGFPFESSIGELKSFQEDIVNSDPDDPKIVTSLIIRGDDRFRKLAVFENPFDVEGGKQVSRKHEKGEAMGGMSGGPVVSLDKEGRARLLGLTTFRKLEFKEAEGSGDKDHYAGSEYYAGAVSVKDIKEFLVETGLRSDEKRTNGIDGQEELEDIIPRSDVSA
jgi:hypothetical protein